MATSARRRTEWLRAFLTDLTDWLVLRRGGPGARRQKAFAPTECQPFIPIARIWRYTGQFRIQRRKTAKKGNTDMDAAMDGSGAHRSSSGLDAG